MLTALVAGCSGGQGTYMGGDVTGGPEATVEEYWDVIDDGDYEDARKLVVGDLLFDDGLYGRGDVDTTTYAVFGDDGENVSVTGVNLERVVRLKPEDEHMQELGAEEGFLVSYSLNGTLERKGARGEPYERDLSGNSMASLVVRKDGAWKIVPDF